MFHHNFWHSQFFGWLKKSHDYKKFTLDPIESFKRKHPVCEIFISWEDDLNSVTIWMVVSTPKFMLKLNPQCDTIKRCGLWKIIQSWRQSTFIRGSRLLGTLLLFFTPAMWGHGIFLLQAVEIMCHLRSSEQPSPDPSFVSTLTLDFADFKTVRNKFLLFINYPTSNTNIQ